MRTGGGRQHARADVAPPRAPRRVFVSGVAGWESKFVIAALEEGGWTVDARLLVAPDHDVLQGRQAGPDTSTHAAVVLIDSASAEHMRGLEQFVRAGGGVVIAGDANRAPRVASLVAWRAGGRENARLGTPAGDTAWRGLSRLPLDSVSARPAIALETRAGRTVVAARRHYAGRVIGVGYDQTWRWRMGDDEGRIAHREWWSRVVASVAARPVTASRVIPSAARDLQFGSAPLAALYDVLGPPTPQTRAVTAGIPAVISNLLGALCLAALFAEWWLRRLRGAR